MWGGGADSLGGGIQEAKRGGRQAGRKGAEQVEGYYGIASIKPEAVVKPLLSKDFISSFLSNIPPFFFLQHCSWEGVVKRCRGWKTVRLQAPLGGWAGL